MIKIEVNAKEITAKDGTTFLSFKGLTKKGWYDLKFRRDAENVPSCSCYIYVDENDVNINRQQRFPIIWVKTVKKLEELKFEQKVSDYFDAE